MDQLLPYMDIIPKIELEALYRGPQWNGVTIGAFERLLLRNLPFFSWRKGEKL